MTKEIRPTQRCTSERSMQDLGSSRIDCLRTSAWKVKDPYETVWSQSFSLCSRLGKSQILTRFSSLPENMTGQNNFSVDSCFLPAFVVFTRLFCHCKLDNSELRRSPLTLKMAFNSDKYHPKWLSTPITLKQESQLDVRPHHRLR